MTYKHIITYANKLGEHKLEYHCTRDTLEKEDLEWILSKASKLHELKKEPNKVWFLKSELINETTKVEAPKISKGEDEDEI